MKNASCQFTLIFIVMCSACFSQNEAKKWLFGLYGGLDFMTNPPTSLPGSSMLASEGSASIADASGNTLFYTNGITIWNQTNGVMANGTGLLGDISATQSSLILKQPGNASLYYVFTLDDFSGTDGLRYSIVDMTLAAGMGSVTTKNSLIYAPSTEKMTAVKHCNGTDIWLISHEKSTNNFRAYLLTATGISASPVISSSGATVPFSTIGQMKASPTGKKIGMVVTDNSTFKGFELHDFDNITGIVSNVTNLGNNFVDPYGCEFSADGTKFYGSSGALSIIYQWDLCTGSGPVLIPSLFNGPMNWLGALQLASDGKIYVCRLSNPTLGVINNPNTPGQACNYNDLGPTLMPFGNINPGSQFGLPNFMATYFKKAPPFTYTVSCNSVSFSAPSQLCTSSGPTFTGFSWDFGDPASLSANQSQLANPVHIYPGIGIYHAKLILSYPCSTDTVSLMLNITSDPPLLTISGGSALCRGATKTLSVSGADSYSWNSGSTASTTVISPTFSTIYTVSGTNTLTGCTASKSYTVAVFPCTGLESPNPEEEKNLLVYPNPAQDELILETDKGGLLIVYNQFGGVVFEQFISRDKQVINIRDLSEGVYLLKLRNGPIEKIRRFIKIN